MVKPQSLNLLWGESCGMAMLGQGGQGRYSLNTRAAVESSTEASIKGQKGYQLKSGMPSGLGGNAGLGT